MGETVFYFLFLFFRRAQIQHGSGQPFHNYFHSKIFHKTLDKSTVHGNIDWFIITGSYLILGFIINNYIPFFEDIQDLIGSLVSLEMNERTNDISTVSECNPSHPITSPHRTAPHRHLTHYNNTIYFALHCIFISNTKQVRSSNCVWMASGVLRFDVLPRCRRIMARSIQRDGPFACTILRCLFLRFSSSFLWNRNGFFCFQSCSGCCRQRKAIFLLNELAK